LRLNTESGSRALMIKIIKILPLKKNSIFLKSKIAIYLSLDFQKGRPSYRRSLKLSKENIQHFRT
jgi:hypothetical protein